jgi:GNAT superfamily N-acetyltransferase
MMRPMRRDDLPWALELTQAEKWSHRLEDWEFHFRLARGWVACTDDGKPVGTASWWAYGPGFGTIGLVLVDRQQQGKGIGRQLMNKIIDDAGARTLQLVATKAGLKLYRDCGFRDVGSIEQRQGIPLPGPRACPPCEAMLRAVTKEDLPALIELDAAAIGAPRIPVIESALAAGSGVIAEHGGRAIGFALMRPSGRGTTIGPLVANDERLAIALANQLMERQDGFIRIDVPSDARQLAAWLDAAGLVRVDEVTTMVRGASPEPRARMRTYGLVSQAIG